MRAVSRKKRDSCCALRARAGRSALLSRERVRASRDETLRALSPRQHPCPRRGRNSAARGPIGTLDSALRSHGPRECVGPTVGLPRTRLHHSQNATEFRRVREAAFTCLARLAWECAAPRLAKAPRALAPCSLVDSLSRTQFFLKDFFLLSSES